MRVEGLWGAEFFSPSGEGSSGVVAFRDGQCFGGDSAYYYAGNYIVSGATLTAELRVTHYHGEAIGVFGPVRDFRLRIMATVGDPWIMGQGSNPMYPHQVISFRLKRLLSF